MERCEVWLLVDDELAAGQHLFNWSDNERRGGVYYLRLTEAGQECLTLPWVKQ